MPLAPFRLLLGFALAALIAFVGYRRHSLSRSGAVGAMLVGAIIFGLGGLAWGILLIVFFVSSSALSHYKETQKEALAEKFSKGGQRDLAQTLANGGAGMIIALLWTVKPDAPLWAAFVGAMAAVNADTWATELGVLSKDAPRLVTNGKIVEVGTSGGVTLAGTLAAAAGAASIAGVGGVAAGGWHLALVGTSGGLLGSLFDSLLGATVQAIYICDGCGKETERHPIHTCGNPTRLSRGWRWLDNDWVNFISSIVGALVAVGLWEWLTRML
ncbi:MAG: DUF92 domain-containing protein [Chloroflexi bacterium]|nr:DUF92 domain-containing protein [Chloroflexota bacterium]